MKKIFHFYLEEDFVLALNVSFPDYSELGYSIPLSDFRKRFGLIVRQYH
ncbi:hypothetical protein [Venenivibrio stagnispumantis]|nr:hypothetical protein [Venenivibrio stagnispumantis]